MPLRLKIWPFMILNILVSAFMIIFLTWTPNKTFTWLVIAGSECAKLKAKGGILLDADAKGVESVSMRNILLYWFMGGTSLTLRAQNGGGIAYASFENIRVRHAKVGIHLVAKDSQSFVNSNTFHDGAISGGIDDNAVLAEGPGKLIATMCLCAYHLRRVSCIN